MSLAAMGWCFVLLWQIDIVIPICHDITGAIIVLLLTMLIVVGSFNMVVPP
jgi:hypothetical protein